MEISLVGEIEIANKIQTELTEAEKIGRENRDRKLKTGNGKI